MIQSVFRTNPYFSYCWGSFLGEKWLILALSLNEVSVAFVLFCLESYLKILSILPPLSFMSQWVDTAQTHKCHHHCLMSRLFMLHWSSTRRLIPSGEKIRLLLQKEGFMHAVGFTKLFNIQGRDLVDSKNHLCPSLIWWHASVIICKIERDCGRSLGNSNVPVHICPKVH